MRLAVAEIAVLRLGRSQHVEHDVFVIDVEEAQVELLLERQPENLGRL